MLFRYTTLMLRTALLLGALAFVNVQRTEAQPVSLTKDMPDAFETKKPTVGDGQYYFIQFYEEVTSAPYLFQPFLGEFGEGNMLHAADYLPYAKNRQWTLEDTGANDPDGNRKFRLKSKRGFYAYYGYHSDPAHPGNTTLNKDCFMATATSGNATEFILKARTDVVRTGFTYYELEVASDGKCLSREKGNQSNNEWADMIKNDPSNAHNYVRFVQLKPNAAHIIYYREEHADGYDNSQYRANNPTTRHYLTYSNTDDNSSAVSSRRSIIPGDKSLWTLPTAAAYHQDGLWTLEETDNDGVFYIKKYGTEEYLKPSDDDNHISILGTKDGANGKYRVENPTVNRYSPIQNLKFEETTLEKSMFHKWDGYGANANQLSDNIDYLVDFKVKNGETLGGGATIAGTGSVYHDIYADLGSNTKMVIKGTPGMPLRVLMSRQQSSSGPLVEKAFSIGSDGKAVVDLTNLELNHATGNATVKMTYVSGSDGTSYEPSNGDPYTIPDNRNTSFGEIQNGAPAYCGYNRISSNGTVILGNIAWNVNNLTYLQVDVSALLGTKGTVRKVTLKGDFQQISDREMIYGVGYNNSTWSSSMTWNTADRSITTLGATQTVSKSNDDVELTFDITDAFQNGNVKTILVYNLAAGAGYIKNPRVTVEYSPNEPVSYAHLNAIKTGYGGVSGTISSITLVNENSEASSGSRYLHYDTGDGAKVPQWITKYGDLWNAAFYPVEVPVPNKDNFFQVLVELKKNKGNIPIELKGTNSNVTITDPIYVDGKLYGGTFTPSGMQKNIFQIQPLNTGTHTQIVIKFGSAVPATGQWRFNAYGSLVDLTGLTEYTLNLNGNIPDFTIFNLDSGADPIRITECYFVQKREMINYSGSTSDYSEDEDERILWQLEQVDDYSFFRLKNPNNGSYLKGVGQVTAPNDPTNAERYANEKFYTDFALKWFLPAEVVEKEIRVEHYVRHRESYLRAYADDQVITDQKGLKKQGLSYDVDSEWKNFDGNLDGFTQKVNHFEITHYVKKGNSRVIEFPTVLNRNNDHIFYQRFFNYDEVDTSMDLDKLKDHVSLDTRDDGDVQYFLYNNGMVTGQKLNWGGIEAHGQARNAQRRFNFTNSDGEQFTVAVDVSRYSDLEYLNQTNPLDDDLREPSLTMRYLFHMNDAKTMAANLTACSEGSDNWLEGNKVFHFGRTQVPYTKFKKVGYRGEFIPIRHIFSDYWVYDDPQLIDPTYLASQGLTGEALNNYLDQHLVSAVNDNEGGKIEVVIDPNGTGIRYGGYNPNVNLNSEDADAEGNDADYQGFYFYDLLSPSPKHEYGNSRFIAFRYPAGGVVNSENPAYIKVYLNNNGTRYQIAQFTIYFDANMATRPWTEIKNGTSYYNGVNQVKGTPRDPNELRKQAGHPIAKVTFDYPDGVTYNYPTSAICPSSDGITRHDGGNRNAGGTIANSSPVPLTFDHTNYSFDGDGCNWGSYALVTKKKTQWGNDKWAYPADDDDYGYDIDADPGMQKAFMYIDASEQPGDICAVEFEGEFCTSDKLMCTGWISGSNRIQGDTRCPGSITLTVKGEDEGGNTSTIYRFCPGQIYELDNGYEMPGATQTNVSGTIGNAGIDGNGNGANHVVWQQFYFEFSTNKKYERYWLEVNNNCVSSNGGDFMLDNVEVYTIVPEVKPEMNTPICVNEDGQVDMRLLKLSVDFNKLKSSSGVNSGAGKLGFVFLEKNKFLTKLKTLKSYAGSIDDLAQQIKDGTYVLPDDDDAYVAAFDEALLRSSSTNETIWESTAQSANQGAGVLYFEWQSAFESNPLFSFYKAVNKERAVYRETVGTGDETVDYIVMNGNFPQLPWKVNTEYYIVPSNAHITSFSEVYANFNICSECSKASVFKIEPPLTVLGLEKSKETHDYVVCEGQIPTLVTDLKGYDFNGVEVPMQDLNYDWWLGADDMIATLDNYHRLQKNGIRLDNALATLRVYYPDATDLNGIIGHLAQSPHPELTLAMVNYLKELVDAGQLVLHQRSISLPAEPVSADDPYFYLVACPIHDDAFARALNPQANQYVAFFCDEPQGLRVKVGDKAPTLKTGFVPGENTFATYDYSAANNALLSIRLAKMEQFETVKHGTEADVPTDDYCTTASTDKHFLWLPIRNAETQVANGVIRKSQDCNVYLASTNDPVNDKNISKAMKNGSLPIVGKIVQLNAINTANGTNLDGQNDKNRLCIYFTENFEVREGYNYTLSLPFQEVGDVNACDGTILINLKIVPDYEVWTGAAGNTDWNNDENWRRADGNTVDHSGLNDDELYVAAAASTSPLYEYKTNKWNYRTSKDRIFRKGFAPLYCTHVLIKSDEWGNAPELYDGLDGKDVLQKTPFPNLRDADDWNGYGAAATATPILRYDMQARHYEQWPETYGQASNKGRDGDLIAEMYQINSCDEIVFQPSTELLNAHLLNYNNAWVEYQLDNKRWYLLGSPLQGTISGEWYAPTGTAKQETTYYDPVTFGTGYDRYSPAIYQRSWDKAKAVLYEIGSTYSTTDDSQTENLGVNWEGSWNGSTWQDPTGETDGTGADEYLDRLGYKPMGGKKANVAIKGVWSNTYNDATVDYSKGAFSVMVMNHLKGNDTSNGKSVIRLPKEDTMYDYYKFSENGSDNGGTDTDLGTIQSGKDRAKNRGRLKTDLLLPTSAQKAEATASIYGDRRTYTRIPTKETDLKAMNSTFAAQGGNPATAGFFAEAVAAGISNMNYYLVENPFPCGLNMNYFFEANTGLEKKYWLLTATGQHLVQKAASGDWISPTLHLGNEDYYDTGYNVLAPGQGFFVEAKTHSDNLTITFNRDMQVHSRYGVPSGSPRKFNIEVGQQQVMEELKEYVDDDNDPDTPDVLQTVTTTVDLNGNGIYGEMGITVDGQTVNEVVPVMVPVWETDTNGDPILDDNGNKIPKLIPVMADVELYTCVQTTNESYKYPLKARGDNFTVTRGASVGSLGLVITAERDGLQSSALVMQYDGASNDFLPSEDTETFICMDELKQVPTVYTLCGRLATSINSIHDFGSLPVGVESDSDAPCTLTFTGVEQLGDSLSFYDAKEQKLTPLKSGMTFEVSGQTQNRYYIVRSLDKQEAAEETHLLIFTEGLTAKVIASTAEPIRSVRCYDTGGRMIHKANPQSQEYSFTLPTAGIYIIEAETENDRKTRKVLVK